MKILLFITLLLFSTLSANKVLYLTHEEIPDRVVKGEVFFVTLKTISTVQDFDDITYEFSNQVGLKVLNTIPYREQKGKFLFDTFHFLATGNTARLPDITASLVVPTDENSEILTQYEKTIIYGKKLNVIALNPKKDFSNIIANSFELIEYKTTSFDTKHNIIVFTAMADNCNLSAIKFKDVYKQGVESISESYINPKVTYFIVVSKDLEKFSFSYFNIIQNRFIKISIPIIVDDDSVTTQSDLKPKDQSKEKLKMNIAAVIAIIILILAIWRRKYIYLFLVLIPLIYIGYIVIPAKEVCIKQGSKIYLLPVSNGTIFETTSSEYNLPKEGTASKFTKVKLKNEKIGWVKNEDICSP
ncbi:hypothetical protein [Sulfurimonas sp.]